MSFLKVGDVAAELNVSAQAVRLWCRTGVLPSRRPSGTRQWLIDRDELAAWLDQGPVREAFDFLHAPYRDDATEEESDVRLREREEHVTSTDA